VKKILLLPILCFLVYVSNAQVGINILEPDSSAVLHLESQDRGFLLPRLTTAQMNAINNPANGLMVYNVSDSLVYYFNDECWLRVYQKNCRECSFTAVVNNTYATIDRTLNDTAYFDIDITKLNGVDSITTIVLSSLPAGMTVTVENPFVDSVGTVRVKVYANIWAPPGSYPLIIQSVCGQNVFYQGVVVEVEPCIIVNVASPLQDVDLQQDFSLPGAGTPVCIIVNVFNNVEISSTVTTNFAMTWGNLDPQSHVGLRHEGYIYARGGNGAPLGNLLNPGSIFPQGGRGGDALELTCRTSFILQGGVYAGGGGGGSVGGSIATPSLPIVGAIVLLEAGVTGGGGSSGGISPQTSGGNIVIGPSLLAPGTNATVGPNSIPGVGGVINYSQPINVGPVIATPFVQLAAGDGGGFGQRGGDATGTAGANIQVVVTIPFVGSVTLFNQTVSGSLGFSQGGDAGIAIKTNNNPTIDLITPNFLIKGIVQP
jgi:hypothetical protein